MTRTKFFSLTATVFTLLFGVFVFPTTAQAKVNITTGTNGDVTVEFIEDGTNSVYVDGTVLESGQTRKSTMVPGNVLEVVNEVKNSGGTICAYDGQKKATTLQGADMGFYVGGSSKVTIKEIASKEVKINNLVVDFGAEKSFTDKDKSGAKFVVKNNMTKLAGTIAEDSSNSSSGNGSSDSSNNSGSNSGSSNSGNSNSGSNSGNTNSGNASGSTNSGNTDSGNTNSGNTSGSTNSGNTNGNTSGNTNSGNTNSGNTGNTNSGNTATVNPGKVVTVPVTANAANAIKKFNDVGSKNKYWSYVKAVNKRGGLKGLTIKRGYTWDGKKGKYVQVSKKKSGTYLDMYSLGGIRKNAKSSSGYISRKDCITMLRNLYGKKYVPVSKSDLTNTAATQKWLTGKLTKIAKNRHVGIKWNSTSNKKLMKLEAIMTVSNCFKIKGMDPLKSYSYKA